MTKYSYGLGSIAKLKTVRHSLHRVCERALGYGIMDASVIQGVRGRTEQNHYYDTGKSKVRWPDSKHNIQELVELSAAVDIAPFIDGKVSWDELHCCVWAGLMLAAAKEEGIDLRWGGCWSGEPGDIGKQSLNDYVHFEVKD